MLDRRVLQHKIAARLDLEEIAATRELIERGQIAGNVVMRVGSLDNNICLQLRGKSRSIRKPCRACTLVTMVHVWRT